MTLKSWVTDNVVSSILTDDVKIFHIYLAYSSNQIRYKETIYT